MGSLDDDGRREAGIAAQQRTFLVMTKLVPGGKLLATWKEAWWAEEIPMASDDDTASIRPMYLSTVSMRAGFGA